MRRKILLIVEDHKDLREMLYDIFCPEFEKVEVAENGKEALAILEKYSKIDCVISDIKMPEWNGVDLIRCAREMQNATPFIFVTGDNANDYREEILNYHSTQLIDKPFRVENLIEAVKKVIASSD